MQLARRKALGLSLAIAVLIGLTVYCAWRIDVVGRRGWAGFSYVPSIRSTTPSPQSSTAGLKPGAVILVFSGVPAERAGMRRGDVIVSIDGIPSTDFKKMGALSQRVHRVLGGGDRVVLFTDGVSEARHGEEEFGDDRLIQLTIRHRDLGARELQERILDALRQFFCRRLPR